MRHKSHTQTEIEISTILKQHGLLVTKERKGTGKAASDDVRIMKRQCDDGASKINITHVHTVTSQFDYS